LVTFLDNHPGTLGELSRRLEQVSRCDWVRLSVEQTTAVR